MGEVVVASVGCVVKMGGDGVMVAFDLVIDVVCVCVVVQQWVICDFVGVCFCVGAVVGDVGWEDGDCFGMFVVVAVWL